MPADLAQLVADIESEARDEGPQAIRELEQLREEFRRLGNNLGNKLSGADEHREPLDPASMRPIA